MTPRSIRAAWVWGGAVVLVVAAAIALIGNTGRRPLDAHEAFVARTAIEMARRGDWIVPYLNGVPRLEKPPMSYWFTGICHRALSGGASEFVTEFEARLPSVLAGLGLVVIAFFMGRAAFDDARVGGVASAMLMTTIGSWTYARCARPEMLYAFFCGLMMLGFIISMREPISSKRRVIAGLGAWGAFAAATLTKGPHLPLMMLAGVAVAIVITRPGRRLRSLLGVIQPLMGLGLVAGIGGAWFFLVAQRVPHALEFWRGELFNRTGAPTELWRNPLQMYYVYAGPMLAAPWLVFIPGALVNPWRGTGAARARPLALLLSGLTAMVVLSFSHGRHAYYLLPALCPFVVLLAHACVDLYDRAKNEASWRHGARALLAVHAVALIAMGVVVVLAPTGGVAPTTLTRMIACTLAGAAILGGVVAIALSRIALAPAFAALTLGVAGVLLSAGVSGASWSQNRTLFAAFARGISERVPPERRIVALTNGLSLVNYYADRRIDRIQPSELASLLAADPAILVIDRWSRLERGLIHGEVELCEVTEAGDDPAVLLSGATASREYTGEAPAPEE